MNFFFFKYIFAWHQYCTILLNVVDITLNPLMCKLEQLNPRSAVKYLPHTRPVDNCLAKIKKLSSSCYNKV